MADSIRIRGGSREGMPRLADRELAYVRDEEALYIGTAEGNVKLCTSSTQADILQLDAAKLTAVPAVCLPLLPDTADTAAVIAAYNALVTALQMCGVMGKEG